MCKWRWPQERAVETPVWLLRNEGGGSAGKVLGRRSGGRLAPAVRVFPNDLACVRLTVVRRNVLARRRLEHVVC